MAISTEAIRKITIEATSKGVTEATDKLHGLDSAHKGVASSGTATATVTDIQSKRSLSAAEAYRRQTLAVVDGARQQDQLARATRAVDSALKQGIITTDQHAARVSLLKEKYGEASVGTRGMAAATSFLSQAMAPLMAMLSVGAVIGFTKSVFDATSKLSEQAQQLGVGVEALQAYRAAFLVSGIAADEGNVIIAKLSKTIGAAKESAGTAREAFAALGIGINDLSTTEGGIQRVAQALLGIEDANKRAYLETQIFGKGGQKVETVLREMAASTDEMIRKGKDLGLVLSSDMADGADKAADRFELAVARMKTAWAPFVANVVGAMADIGERFSSGERRAAESQVLKEQGKNWGAAWYSKDEGFTSRVAEVMQQNRVEAQRQQARDNTLQPPIYGNSSSFDFGAETTVTTGKSSTPGTSWDTTAEQRVLASAKEEARLAQLTATERAAENEVIQRAGELQTINGVKSSEISKTYAASAAYLTDHLGKQGLQLYRNLGIQKEQATAGEKIKVTFDGYLASLGEEARLAGLTTEERTKQESVIKGAQVYQREHGVLAKNIVQTYGAARKVLGDQNVSMIEMEATQKRINALAARFSEQAHSALKDYQDAVAAIDQNVSNGAYSSQEGDVQKAGLQLNQQRLSAQSQMGQSNPFGAGADIAVSAQKEIAGNEKNSSLAANDNWFKAGLESEQTYADMKVAINQDYADRVQQIETSLASARLQIGESSFGQMADALGGLVGKTSDAYKVMFGISKAFAIADAMIQLPAAMMKALDTPFPANLAAIATVASLGASIISNIVSVAAPSGYANGIIGLDGPGTGTSDSILIRASRGESVITAAGTDRNPRTLAAINAGASFDQVANDRGGGNVVNFTISVDARGAQEGVSDQLDRKINELVPVLANKIIAITDSRSGTNTATANRNPRRR